MLKSGIFPYKFAYLRMIKNIGQHPKNIERGQNIFELHIRLIRHENSNTIFHFDMEYQSCFWWNTIRFGKLL